MRPGLGGLTMSHLHIPDGLLPVALWAPALLVSVLLLALAGRGSTPRRVAFQGALGALMLVAMSIPLGAIDYHLALTGPVGVLLGGAGAFQVTFVVSAFQSLLGHGGITSVGLNALVLGSGAVVARPVFLAVARRASVPTALACATLAAQVVSGGLWIAVMMLAFRVTGGGAGLEMAGHEHAGGAHASSPHPAWFFGLAIPLWALGSAIEAIVAWSIGRFLSRVSPGLLPGVPVTVEAQTGS